MSLTGDWTGLRWLTEKLRDAARGKLLAEVRGELATELEKRARDVRSRHQSPGGCPWFGTHGSLSLVRSGGLRASLRVDVLPNGVRLSIGPGKTFARGNQAQVQQRGGDIVSAGGKQLSVRAKGRRAMANWSSGQGLMRFRVGGRWVSTYAVHLRANLMLPRPGSLPSAWGAALHDAVQRAVRRWSR